MTFPIRGFNRACPLPPRSPVLQGPPVGSPRSPWTRLCAFHDGFLALDGGGGSLGIRDQLAAKVAALRELNQCTDPKVTQGNHNLPTEIATILIRHRLRDEGALSLLIEVAGNKGFSNTRKNAWQLKMGAVAALRQLLEPTSREVALQLLQDSKQDPMLRAKAAEIVGILGDASEAEVLYKLLNGDREDAEVRVAAAVGLGYLKRADLLEGFLSRHQSQRLDWSLQEGVSKALKYINERRMGRLETDVAEVERAREFMGSFSHKEIRRLFSPEGERNLFSDLTPEELVVMRLLAIPYLESLYQSWQHEIVPTLVFILLIEDPSHTTELKMAAARALSALKYQYIPGKVVFGNKASFGALLDAICLAKTYGDDQTLNDLIAMCRYFAFRIGHFMSDEVFLAWLTTELINTARLERLGLT